MAGWRGGRRLLGAARRPRCPRLSLTHPLPLQRAFPGTVGTWQDSGDFTNQISVIAVPTSKASVTDLGTPEETLDAVKYVMGDSTAYTGATRSEGGFAENKIAKASLLDVKEYTKGGKAYRQFHVLTRTADGDEGGRHNFITVAVSSAGLLTLQHIVVGDKRFFKGADKGAMRSADSFTVV